MRSSTQYDRVQVALHWVIALLILAMIGLGLYMVELPKKHELPPGAESVRAFYFLLHKSIGITAFFLILARLVWRLTHVAPALPAHIPLWQQRAAGSVHLMLYALLFAMPLSGYFQSMYSKYPTRFWGLELPRVAEASKELREQFAVVHEIIAFTLIALILIHIIAAVRHRLSGNDEIARRMSFKDN